MSDVDTFLLDQTPLTLQQRLDMAERELKEYETTVQALAEQLQRTNDPRPGAASRFDAFVWKAM